MKSIPTLKSFIFGGGILCALAAIVFWNCKREDDPKRSEKSITAFVIKQADNKDLATDLVGAISRTIVTLPPPPNSAQSPDIQRLTPSIEVSAGATVSPASGIPQDFTNPVPYTVTAEDGSKQNYTVTLTLNKNGDKAITAFVFQKADNPALSADAVGTISGANVTFAPLPVGADLTALKPTIVISAEATIAPASGAAQNFTKPVVYVVAAEDGSTQEYAVTVTVGRSSDKAITAFVFRKIDNPTLSGDVAGTMSGTNVTFSPLPVGTDVTALKPTIVISAEATIAPASGAAQNFGKSVKYTVTAEDGSTQDYVVTVTVGRSSDKAITSFVFRKADNSGLAGDLSGTVSGASITFPQLPAGTVVTALKPTITTSAAATVTPAGGVARDFTNAVKYTVTAQDGTTQEYTVTVTVQKRTEKAITSFVFRRADNSALAGDLSGTVSGASIAVSVPAGTVVTALKPTITIPASATISPASGVARDFTNPVKYAVTAQDGSTQEYNVTVTVQKSAEKAITSFVFRKADNSALAADAVGTISGASIAVSVPAGTAITSLKPTIAISAAATISPANGVARDFTNPVKYAVTAQDGSTQEYTVTVTVGRSSDKAITSFVFRKADNSALAADAIGTISGASIAVSVPAGTAITSLKPTIAISASATVTPASGVAKDFTNSVKYTVTAQDGTTQEYAVTVTVGRSSDKAITSFVFRQADNSALAADAIGTISGANIAVSVPAGTAITSLKPTIAISASATVTPAGGVAKDFTNSVKYTVTAQDGTTQEYAVTVTVGRSSDKAITSFVFRQADNPALSSDFAGIVSGTSIRVPLPTGTNVSALKPIVTLSAGATVSPASGAAQNFANPVTYAVTAEDGSTQNYAVTATLAKAFITVWRTASANESIALPLVSGGTYDFTVNWGDGTSHRITRWDDANKTHRYAAAGDYTVTIAGTLKGWAFHLQFYDANGAEKLIEIKAWGEMAFGATETQFAGATNLRITATDSPDLSQTASLQGCFYQATNFNSDISNWNTANVTNMERMFYKATAFNQPIGNWNTANVTNMSYMFYKAYDFNQPIGTWNTANVTNMEGMFRSANKFNQPLDNWNTANVTNMGWMFAGDFFYDSNQNRDIYKGPAFDQPIGNWNTANVTNMSDMFSGAGKFNQPIGNWNTANVTNMSGMFSGYRYGYNNIYSTTFNQNLSGWNVSKVTDCRSFSRYSGLSYYNKPRFTNCSE